MSTDSAVAAARPCALEDPELQVLDATPETRIKVKRVCNGCGFQVGDVTGEEMAFAVDGRQLPDVRGECLVCRPIPAPREEP